MSMSLADQDKAAQQGKTRHLPAWKVILKMVQFRPRLWLINLGAMVLLTIFWQLPGIVMREFFNIITGNEQAGFTIWSIAALLLAFELGRDASLYGLIRSNVPFFVHTMTLLRKNLLKYILKRPGAKALPDSPGEATSRFGNDVFEIPLFALWLNDIQGIVFFGIVAVAIMLSINVTITIVAIIPFIFVGFIAAAATSKIEQYRRASRRAAGIVVGFIGEFFGAAQAVKVATAEEGVIAHFRNLNDDRRKVALRDRLFNEVLNSIFRNGVNLGTGIILILAGQAMQARTFTVGDFWLFVFFLDGISELATFTGLLVARYKQIGVSVERMTRLMEGAPDKALVEFSPVYMDGHFPQVVYPAKTPEDELNSLHVEHLSYHYPGTDQQGGFHGIEDVSLHLKRGTLTVVTGRVGSGKTTLLRTLIGLLPRDRGDIVWNGARVDNPADFFTPPRCAYTAQVPRLFSNSLRDNLLMGMDKTDSMIQNAIMLAVMDKDMADLEKGLDTMVGPKGVKLSGGQIQRTAAARMFVREPELLVFDDLSSALDVETERALWERVLDGASNGTESSEGLSSPRKFTCLVVSHRKAALHRADHIIVLKDGMVVAEGKLPELLATCEEMQRLYHGETSEEKEERTVRV